MSLFVHARPGNRLQGLARLGPRTLVCALGSSGLRARKREGDGATPAGVWRLRQVLYRAGRVARPRTRLPARAIRADDGWCDAPADGNYNRAVRLPYPASTERMWREDRLYDIVVVLDHNHCPRIRGRGSAVFIHIARDGFASTEGCLAFTRRDLMLLLARARRGSRVVILA